LREVVSEFFKPKKKKEFKSWKDDTDEEEEAKE